MGNKDHKWEDLISVSSVFLGSANAYFVSPF